jgi:hypothetical protein
VHEHEFALEFAMDPSGSGNGGEGEGEEENYNPVKWRAKKTARGRQKQIGNYSKGDRFLMAASGVLAGRGKALPPIYARSTNKST